MKRLASQSALAVFVACAGSAVADEVARNNEATIYVARGVDSDLLEMLPDALQGDLKFDDTHFMGIGYVRLLPTPSLLQRFFDAVALPNTRIGVEGVLVKHNGLQSNSEADVAFAMRFGAIHLGPIAARLGFGIGLSYAFGTPSYEDGPLDDPDRRYKLQNFNNYELALSDRDLPDWSIVLRVHHRSGVYGVVAPRRVGSNFLACGIRFMY